MLKVLVGPIIAAMIALFGGGVFVNASRLG
jgi:hypothetical protein